MLTKGKKILVGTLCVLATIGAAGAVAGIIYQQKALNIIDDTIRSDKWLGVEFGADGEATRLGAAEGKLAGINGERNDFDLLPVYRKIHTYAENGEKKWMVNDFYYKHVVTGTVGSEGFKEAFYVCEKQLDDTWTLPAAFVDAKGENRGHFTLGAYKASYNDDKTKLLSKKGSYGAVALTLEEGRKLAKANSAVVAEQRKTDIVNTLMMIEFAQRDVQDTFQGMIGSQMTASWDATLNAATGKVNYLNISSNQSIPDLIKAWTPGLGVFVTDGAGETYDGGFRTITGVSVENLATSSSAASSSSAPASTTRVAKISFDGEGIDFSALNATIAEKTGVNNNTVELDTGYAINGICDSLAGSSHELKSINGHDLAVGNRPFAWRGLENVYGSTFEMIDGSVMKTVSSATPANKKATLDVCMDPALYGEAKDGMTSAIDYKTAFTLGTFVSNALDIAAFQSDAEGFEGMLVPGQTVADSTFEAYYGDVAGLRDNSAATSETTVYSGLYRGTAAGSNRSIGPSFVDGNDFANANCSIGARLSFDI